MRIVRIILIVAIWGLLAWGNYSLINWANNNYNDNMANNYQISTYQGKVLLTHEEYDELKHYLVKESVSILELDTYDTGDILIKYRIHAPSTEYIPFVGEAVAQSWYYPQGRIFDYFMFFAFGIISLIIGGWFTIHILGIGL